MELLLLSNSTNAGEVFLEYAMPQIQKFLGKEQKNCVFIPYAAVAIGYDEYETKVAEKFSEAGYILKSVHNYSYPAQAIKNADAIIVGGGNTFHLLHQMQKNDLLNAIRERVAEGIPYIGWSAGSNVACPGLYTSNDMPIIGPKSFEALNLVTFQINPHYLDANPDGHAGETREARIEEFLIVHPNVYVVGLREGTMLKISGNKITLIGARKARIFKSGMEPLELGTRDNFEFLLAD